MSEDANLAELEKLVADRSYITATRYLGWAVKRIRELQSEVAKKPKTCEECQHEIDRLEELLRYRELLLKEWLQEPFDPMIPVIGGILVGLKERTREVLQ